MINDNVTENSSCISNYQYNYIQYPYDHIQQHPQMLQFSSASNPYCNCRCSSTGVCNDQVQQLPSESAISNQILKNNLDSTMAVAVIVHQQTGQQFDDQSLYQELQQPQESEENKQLNNASSRNRNNCDCDVECTCLSSAIKRGMSTSALKKAKTNGKAVELPDAMLGADEITVSESDNNSTIKKKYMGNKGEQNKSKFTQWGNNNALFKKQTNFNDIDAYTDGGNINDPHYCPNGKTNDHIPAAATDSGDHRPPLPPRPPLLPRTLTVNFNGHRHNADTRMDGGIKKYVVCCLICGGCSCLLGLLFLGVYFLLHSYTITVGNFETVPTFVPATLLILTGLCVMSLAQRRNRFSYLIKLSGACGLISALTCALVTITTTVLHMSRLQSLRECEYAQKTRTCTCYSDMIESQDRIDKEGVRLVFDSLSDCGVVHGSLYSCLRAIFGLSVAGVLIAVFSCMLIYQLLSHERKKMYWEQLELRCRSLYTTQQGPPSSITTVTGVRNVYRCCDQCHANLPPVTNAWDHTSASEARFWTGQPPGNFYSPNPGSDELHLNVQDRSQPVSGSRNRATGWSWHRWWNRSLPNSNNILLQPTPVSADSQYGFSHVNDQQGALNDTGLSAVAPLQDSQQAFGLLSTNGLPYGIWGPPPPYSDPNSPARRTYSAYNQPHACIRNNGRLLTDDHQHAQQVNTSTLETTIALIKPMPYLNSQQDAAMTCSTESQNLRNTTRRFKCSGKRDGAEYESSNSDGCGEAFSNSTIKVKKRMETDKKSIGHNKQIANQHTNVQEVPAASFSNRRSCDWTRSTSEEDRKIPGSISMRNKHSIADTTFESGRHGAGTQGDAIQQAASDATESEVYFADVSSCCNMSLKIDSYYEDGNPQQPSTSCCQNNKMNKDCVGTPCVQSVHSIRSCVAFSPLQCENKAYQENYKGMSKEISQLTMGSVESEPQTELTDVSPSTPCTTKLLQLPFNVKTPYPENHVAMSHCSSSLSLYSAEQAEIEAHRCSSNNMQQ